MKKALKNKFAAQGVLELTTQLGKASLKAEYYEKAAKEIAKDADKTINKMKAVFSEDQKRNNAIIDENKKTINALCEEKLEMHKKLNQLTEHFEEVLRNEPESLAAKVALEIITPVPVGGCVTN